MSGPRIKITASEAAGNGYIVKFSDGEELNIPSAFKLESESVVTLPNDYGFTASYLRAIADWMDKL